MWSVGCFYRTGREYERIVKYAESVLEDERLRKIMI